MYTLKNLSKKSAVLLSALLLSLTSLTAFAGTVHYNYHTVHCHNGYCTSHYYHYYRHCAYGRCWVDHTRYNYHYYR